MLEGKNVKTVERKPLVGERILLRPFSKRDLQNIQLWSADAELRKLIGEVAPMSEAEAEKFYKELRTDKDRVWFVVVLKKNGRVIGEAGLLRMFRPWRSTDMTIIIGEKDAWGKGYGTEVGHLLLDYVFRRLGFHRVSVGVVGFNKRALRFWESLGFKKEGVERDAHYYDNEYSDGVMMSILEDEFKKGHKGTAGKKSMSRMAEKERFVSLEEATHEVEIAITRLALLHLSFSRTLVEELGEKKGKELVIRSILDYGKWVGERVKHGLPDLPKYGVYGGEKDGKVYDCVLAKVFHEYGEEDIGCLYCYVDPAKSMVIDPDRKVTHKDCAACGDDYCTFKLGPTTKKERADFGSMGSDWRNVDPRLVQGSKLMNANRPKKK